MNVNFHEIHDIDDALLSYAVIVSRYMDKWVFCKNKTRKSWEIPGGRREANEAIFDTAKRELFEETGAVEFNIMPICVYSVENESFGMLFFADIIELGRLPDLEIEKIDFFEDIPENLSFPLIMPKLIGRVKNVLHIV